MKPLHGTPLKRFLRDYRRSHPSERIISAILQSVEYPANVGSAFRLADGANVSELLLTGITPQPPHPTIDKVGRNKHSRVPWQYMKEPADAIAHAKSNGAHIIAVELTENAVPYHQYEYPDNVCLVVGHEDHGVTKSTLALCDAAVFLPMYGKGLSLNVHTALGIMLWHIRHAD